MKPPPSPLYQLLSRFIGRDSLFPLTFSPPLVLQKTIWNKGTGYLVTYWPNTIPPTQSTVCYTEGSEAKKETKNNKSSS